MIIPHEILLAPGEYLTGAYPVLQQLFAQYRETPTKCERIKKAEEISLTHCARYASMQASGFINVMEHLGFDDTEIVTLLKGGKKKFSKRLNADKYDCNHADVIYLHQLLAGAQDSTVKDYMDTLYRQEQEVNRQKYFDRMEQDALLYRMQQHYQPHYLEQMEQYHENKKAFFS